MSRVMTFYIIIMIDVPFVIMFYSLFTLILLYAFEQRINPYFTINNVRYFVNESTTVESLFYI